MQAGFCTYHMVIWKSSFWQNGNGWERVQNLMSDSVFPPKTVNLLDVEVFV